MHFLNDLPEPIYQKGLIEIEYLPKYCTLTISWSGKIEEEEYRTALSELHKFIILYEIKHLLIDARESDTYERGNYEWMCNFFSEKLGKTSLQKIARIGCGYLMREALVSKMITEFHRSQKLPYIFRYVNDVNAALEWFAEE